MMKSLFLISVTVLFFACTHKNHSDDRSPSGVIQSGYQQVTQCGELSYGESNRVALNAEDVMYNLALDCNRDRKVDAQDQYLAVGFPISQMSPQQKGHITRFTRAAVIQQKKYSARPYVCAKFQIAQDPCVSQKSAIGYNPSFTSKIEKVLKK